MHLVDRWAAASSGERGNKNGVWLGWFSVLNGAACRVLMHAKRMSHTGQRQIDPHKTARAHTHTPDRRLTHLWLLAKLRRGAERSEQRTVGEVG